MDAPDHMKYRLLTQGWFMPKNLRIVEDRIRGLARATVDHMLSLGGTCDFARDVAAHYPLRVIMDILGVPAEDEPRMLMLTQRSEEHTSELQSLMRISYAVFCLKKKTTKHA